MRRQLRLTSLIVLLGIMLLAGAEAIGQGTTRTPVPSGSDQDNAMSMARALFKSEYSKADTPTAKTALAKKILEQADAAKGNAATHFVLLRLARDIAVQAGDLEVATQAIDAMAAVFEVDAAKMKVEVLSGLVGKGPPATPNAKHGEATPDAGAAGEHEVLANSIGMKLVLIPAGEFWMGSTPEQIARVSEENSKKGRRHWTPGEGPRHQVRISRPFYFGTYEVTQGEYNRVMYAGDDSSSQSADEPTKPGEADRNLAPARMISWDDANQFCQRLSAMRKEKAAKRAYRLPSEAEWEYACRAGTTTLWHFGDSPTALGDHAWFKDNSGATIHPVGQKKPNPWGLFDMYGNVSEWCSDRWGKYSYRESPIVDPQGASGGDRVMRGGNFHMGELACRSAGLRDTPMHTTFRDSDLGFRVVCQVGEGGKSGKPRSSRKR